MTLMQFTTKSQFFFLILALLSIISFVPVNALPISNIQVKRDVYVPPVLYPHSGTVWKVGQTYSVTWDNSNPPHQITNPIGQIYLRKGDRTESTPLASGFKLTSGKTTITIPKVPTGSDYRIVLMGDSGDWSDAFTIDA